MTLTDIVNNCTPEQLQSRIHSLNKGMIRGKVIQILPTSPLTMDSKTGEHTRDYLIVYWRGE